MIELKVGCFKWPRRVNWYVALAACASFGSAAIADETKTLTGDWGGLRTRLENDGVALTTIYTSEIANNPRGGNEDRTAYTDEFAFGATLDLEKLLSLNAAQFQLTITERYGKDLDQTARLHTLMQVEDLYGRGQTWRLTELWYKQGWLDDRLVWKFGRLTVGENFGSFTCNFQNLTFCGSQPGNVRGDYWYNYPVSQWGTRLDFAAGATIKLRLGVYQVNPTYIDDSWAAHNGLLPDNPSGTTGALIPMEVDWTPSILGKSADYKFGAWYDTSNADDVYFNIDYQPLVIAGGKPLRRQARYGAYANFVQQISGETPEQGTQLFLNVTQADRDTSPSIDRQVAFGVQYKGPFNRPTDVIGFGAGTTHVNSRVAAGERLMNAISGSTVPVQTSEYASEIFYGWAPWAGLMLRPNLQYVAHAGGSDSYKNVLVLGLKTTAKF